MDRIRKIGSAYLQLFTNLISIFNVYTKLVIQLQKWNATVLLRKSGRLASQYAADDKLDKVLENPQVNPVLSAGCLEKLELEDKNMVKKIMRSPLFLAQKSTDATEADQQVITDLLDTLRANLDHCVGMAANMIGVKKNIIVVAAGPFQFAMVNPVITKKTGAFQTEEGCLSLEGVRPCTRYKEIEVDYLDANFKKQHGKYSGWTAQIIQHEIDHCNGVVI